MPYRNDQEALRGRVHSLEGQLREAREHLEQLRTPSPHPTKARRSKGRGHITSPQTKRSASALSSTRSRMKNSKWMATLTVAILVGIAAAGPYMLALGPFTGPSGAFKTIAVGAFTGTVSLVASSALKG